MALVLLTGEGVERSLVSLAGTGLSARKTREVEKARALLLRRQRLVRRAGSIVCGCVRGCESDWRFGCAMLDSRGAVVAPRLGMVCALSVSAPALSAVRCL